MLKIKLFHLNLLKKLLILGGDIDRFVTKYTAKMLKNKF